MFGISNYLKPKCMSYVLSFIKLYCRYEHNIKNIYEKQVANNYFFKKISQKFLNIVYFIKTHLLKHKLEPYDQYWISTSVLEDNQFNEEYIFFNSCLFFINKKTKINEPQNYDVSFLKKIENDKLFILKTDNVYLSRVSFKNVSFCEMTTEKTPKCFLVVEYTHPEMTKPVVLEINQNYFVENNEILSNIFVLRCLKYQYEPYIFDEKYVLKIIDNDIEDFILKPTQYVKILKDKYVIMENY